MYERESRGSRGGAKRRRWCAGHEVVRPFKSRFFWPHRHSQNSSIYPIDVEQSHLHESTMLRMTIRATSSAINSSYLLTADYSYLYVFTSHIRFLPQGKSQDYEAVKNKISRLRICIAREEKYGGKKRQITRKVEPLRLSWY